MSSGTETASNTSPIHAFYLSFQEEHSILDGLIDNFANLPASSRAAAIDDYLLRINHLSDKVKDAASYLPPYDQRKYSEHIKALSDKLSHVRKAIAPKQKFSFKSKAKPKTSPIPTISNKPDPTFSTTTASSTPSASTATQNHITISSFNSQYIHPLPHTHFSPISISSLISCFVDLPLNTNGHILSMLAVKDVTSSIIFAPDVSGPAHLTSIRSSILILSCAQFRMHDTHDTDVYLICPSRPIIEDCSGIRFAPLPAQWIPPRMQEKQGGREAGARKNMWDQVDDFKWLRAEHSPNWSVIPENEWVEEGVWRQVMEIVGEKSKDEAGEAGEDGVVKAELDIGNILRLMGKST